MISIILPSVRPELLVGCLNGIVSGAISVDIEIILVSDYEPNLTHEVMENLKIKWVYEKERKGVVCAINNGLSISRGEYLFSLSDEALLSTGAFLNMQRFSESVGDMCILTPKHLPAFNFEYYQRPFAPFPFVHRKVIDALNGVFIDPAYKAFYADPDLSMRALTSNIPVYTCETAEIYHPNNMSCPAHVHNVNAYLDQDRATFRARWDHLGKFVDP